ncbi:sigma-70 family RNA polymerase sigma factor [Dehalobacter sp.]|uniref:RNA polymerase sigma factor n=1 Tax=Dehalobacter sp. TaxID=1962289 RepID=UPI00258630B7|nr:sigma-70 family RNA polymerase sigma factor [Dehalobacter sp.]MCG1024515.1 sigma-70 family RNA polymerase sigma factor [Dehalobacter sp.]
MPTNDNQQPITERFIEIDGQQIPVSEAVYRAYKRPAWAEHKRKEREKRCRDDNGNRCTGDCSNCDKQRTGSVLSLDRFTDEGFEVSDTVDLTELIADKFLFEELYAALEELDPDNRRIMELFSIGKSEREIATDIGLSQKAINKRKTKLFSQLRERLKDFI